MPIGSGVRYGMTQTAKGPVRLAFKGNRVVEAKNMKTGAMHSPEEFEEERRKKHSEIALKSMRHKPRGM